MENQDPTDPVPDPQDPENEEFFLEDDLEEIVDPDEDRPPDGQSWNVDAISGSCGPATCAVHVM